MIEIFMNAVPLGSNEMQHSPVKQRFSITDNKRGKP